MSLATAGPAVGGMPRFSVVVCANATERRHELLAAVESLHLQSQPPREVIVVIDHNPDLQVWASTHLPGAEVVANTDAPGLAGARNSGVREASGDVVAFLDDDAVAAPYWLERLGAAYGDPGVIGAGGAVIGDWEERPGWFPREFDWVVGCSYRGLPSVRTPVRNLIGCNMSFRRDAFDLAGGFTESLGRVARQPLGCEETEFCIRVGREAAGRPVLYDPGAAVYHRVPRERASRRYFLKRCWYEGVSKAAVARLAGAGTGLASERTYTFRTLPAGMWSELRSGNIGRALAIPVGLAATIMGFAFGFIRERLAARTGSGVEVPA